MRYGSQMTAGETAAVTKAEASDRLGRDRPWLLPVGDPPERQSVAEFSAGDKGGASTACEESAQIVPHHQSRLPI